MSTVDRPDRLAHIRERLKYPDVWYLGDGVSRADIAWLVAEVERLRKEIEPESDESRRATIQRIQQFERGR